MMPVTASHGGTGTGSDTGSGTGSHNLKFNSKLNILYNGKLELSESFTGKLSQAVVLTEYQNFNFKPEVNRSGSHFSSLLVGVSV